MVKRSSHIGKSFSDKAEYFSKMVKTSHGEDKTFEEKDFDGTDTSPVREEREVTKKEPRWRSPKKIIKEKAKSYLWLALVVPGSLWFINFLFAINSDIAKLEERSKDIQFMKEKIITIDKNVETMKILSEKNIEIYELMIKGLQNRVDELTKKK